MGSSVVVSRNLHHNLIKPLLSRHACACASRWHNFHSNSNNTSLSDRERKGGRESGSHFQFLIQRDCKKIHNGIYFSLLSTENNWAAPVREFRSPDFPIWRYFRGVCDGVLHFSGTCPKSRDYLWMPSANQSRLIPPSKLTRLPGAYYMDFDSSGFGFDPMSQDYKVVRFASHYFGDPDGYYPKNTIVQAEVYSLKNDSWKEIPQIPIKNCFHWSLATTVYVSGRYYWRDTVAAFRDSIVSFDFATEEFSRVDLPPQLKEKWELLGDMYGCMLVEVDGKLGMVICYKYPGTGKSVWELWVLKDKEWSRGFEIRYLENIYCSLLYSSDAGLLFLRGVGVDGELLVYDIRNQELKKLGHYGNVWCIIPYIASASAPWI